MTYDAHKETGSRIGRKVPLTFRNWARLTVTMQMSDGKKSAPVQLVPNVGIHPAWLRLIELCRAMGFGELERVKIQDGVPTIAEIVKERVKLT
jgi:hypothetical protein